MGGCIVRSLAFAVCFVLARQSDADPINAGELGSRRKTTAHSQPSAIETANFRIYGIARLADAQQIGDDFEKLRCELSRTWRGGRHLRDWSPKCDVVVHATAASYLRAVGQDQFASVGASRVDTIGDQVTLRRLDIRADRVGWFAAAVPHELTHVIMADEFPSGQLPAWADEGMAVLADTRAKRRLHERDLRVGQGQAKHFRLVKVVAQKSYPRAAEIPMFYGQSASLVAFLVARRSPADFVCFLHRTEEAGCEIALAEVYGYRSLADLERDWLAAAR